MLKIIFLVAILLSSNSYAQTARDDSRELSAFLVEDTWKTMEQILAAAITGLEVQLRNTGATDKAAKVFSEELRRSFNKENMTKALALLYSENFTTEETKELLAFLRSELGQRYTRINGDSNNSLKHITFMLK
jgi:hypothetical protein